MQIQGVRGNFLSTACLIVNCSLVEVHTTCCSETERRRRVVSTLCRSRVQICTDCSFVIFLSYSRKIPDFCMVDIVILFMVGNHRIQMDLSLVTLCY